MTILICGPTFCGLQYLELYVFDDDEEETVEAGYLGLAQVPLLPLSQGKPISGTFQLKQVV